MLFRSVSQSRYKAFVDKQGKIFFKPGFICTSFDEAEGANYYIPDHQYEGIYNIEMLMLLEGVAKSIDWTTYPRPCLFMGDRLRGAIVGMRM